MRKNSKHTNLSIDEKKKKYYQSQFRAYKRLWSRDNLDRKKILDDSRVRVDNGFNKWTCNSCKGFFAESEVEVDHIMPVNKSPNNIVDLIKSIELNESDNLQLLCIKCHKIKTKIDNNNKNKDNCIKIIEDINKSLGDYELFTNKLVQYDYEKLKKIKRFIIKLIEEKNIDKKLKVWGKCKDILDS